MVKLDAGDDGSLTLNPRFFVEGAEMRPLQVRLEGDVAWSDADCYS
jgi:hypothetical protein